MNLSGGAHSMDLSHDGKSYMASTLESKIKLIDGEAGMVLQEF